MASAEILSQYEKQTIAFLHILYSTNATTKTTMICIDMFK